MRAERCCLLAVIGVTAAWVCADTGQGGDEHTQRRDRQCRIELGEPAPEFALFGVDGKTYRLSDCKDKIVILEWTDHQCPEVDRCYDAEVTAKLVEKFKDKPVVWLAVVSSPTADEDREEIRTWAERKGLPYPVLLDATGEVGHSYGAKTTPHLFVIDRKGILVYSGALDNDPHRTRTNDMRPYVDWAVTALMTDTNIPRTLTQPYGCDVKYASR